jgi:hypothetical protein
MSSTTLNGTIDLVLPESKSSEQPLFDNDEILHIYVEDISQVPTTESAQEHPKSSGSILLGETTIHLAQDHKFPLEFQCKYDPTTASNGQFDKLCKEGLIVVAAEIDADGRDMTKFWLKSGPKKFEKNIKLTLTNSYG